MRAKRKHPAPARQDLSAAPKRARRSADTIEDWADGADMLEGLGGIDPDYDRADDAVPPELRMQWRPSRFEGE